MIHLDKPISERDQLVQYLMSLGPRISTLILTSDPLRKIYEQVRLVVYLNAPGCWLSAPFRRGKSSAIEYCAKRLKTEIPGLPVFIVNEQILPGNELRSFFIRALTESGYDKPVSRDATTLRHRLPMYWAELSKFSPLKCVVLLLDECQSMRELDESLIKDLSNQIVRLGGALLTISFGESPSFDAMVSKRTDPSKVNGAVDRLFGGQKLEIFGYEDESDWKSLFSQMDSVIFEELGGKTIAQAYFSHMNMRDFRMENEVTNFLRLLKREYGSTPVGGVNLSHIFVGVRHALLMTSLESVHKKLSSIQSIREEVWIESIRFGANSVRIK
jgi:hypothetical protein